MIRIHFSVGGACFPYHLGAIDQIKGQINNQDFESNIIFTGTSVGSIMATIIALNIDTTNFIERCTQEQYKILNYQRSFWGKWKESLEIILNEFITEIDSPVTNLYINAFNVNTYQNDVFSYFDNKQQIIDAIYKSCHVPFILDFNITFNNYLDGVVSNILFGINWNLYESKLIVIKVPIYYIITQALLPLSEYNKHKLYNMGVNDLQELTKNIS